MIFRVRTDLLTGVRRDLARRHLFAHERVGFFFCRAGHLDANGLLILAVAYEPVADEDYIVNPKVGATIGPGAFRRALQRAYNGGACDLSLFHVHMHNHEGLPGFSRVDRTETLRFVPDFFNAVPAMPHGAVILSQDLAVGLCWRTKQGTPAAITEFASVGAPLQIWRGSK